MNRVHKIFYDFIHNNGIIFYLGAGSQKPEAKSQEPEYFPVRKLSEFILSLPARSGRRASIRIFLSGLPKII
jgi:hypothetical protein